MNRLLQLSFGKLGYTYDFLVDMVKCYYADGYAFPGEDRICLALKQLRKAKSRIVILPDFDMDGIAAGCNLYAGLSVMGFVVELYEPVPDRGYGFKRADIDAILKQWPDTVAILTCDVGIGEKDAIAYARSRGLLVYVTDHHPEEVTSVSSADAIFDPSRLDSNAPFTQVCGAWVAWHLVNLYAKLDGSAMEQALCRKLILFAGLGTCGDLMEMKHDSRLAVQESVAEFNKLLQCEDMDEYFGCPAVMLPERYAAPFENLRSLHFYLADLEKVKRDEVTDETYSFTYVPMFNCVQRMGERIENVYRLLYYRYPWNSLDRLTLFKWFYDLNEARKEEVANLYAQLVDASEQGLAPYIYLVDGKRGLMGLLAAKLMEHSGAPTLVMRPCDDKPGFKGSGRTPEWFQRGNLFDLKGVSRDGHEHAFGVFCIESMLGQLKARMDAQYRSELMRHLSEPENVADPRPVICMGGHASCGDYDFSVTSMDDYDACMDFVHEVNRFRPFGRGFSMPEFVIKFLSEDAKSVRIMGKDKSHLRFDLGYGISAVWFGGAKFADELYVPGKVHAIAGTFGLNEFGGSVSLQFQVTGKA